MMVKASTTAVQITLGVGLRAVSYVLEISLIV